MRRRQILDCTLRGIDFSTADMARLSRPAEIRRRSPCSSQNGETSNSGPGEQEKSSLPEPVTAPRAPLFESCDKGHPVQRYRPKPAERVAHHRRPTPQPPGQTRTSKYTIISSLPAEAAMSEIVDSCGMALPSACRETGSPSVSKFSDMFFLPS